MNKLRELSKTWYLQQKLFLTEGKNIWSLDTSNSSCHQTRRYLFYFYWRVINPTL